MAQFVDYTPVTVKTLAYSPVSFAGPLDSYLKQLQSTTTSSALTQSEATSNNSNTFLWISSGTSERPYTQTTLRVTYFQNLPLQASNSALNQALRLSADYAKNNAKSKSTHRCAHYVSNALEAAGIRGFNRKDGKDYDLVTALLGMHDVTGESTFKKGDIAVTKTNDGTGHVAICNRDGASINDQDAWSSDFNSRAHPYSLNRITYAHVFRALKGIKLIKKNKI